MSSQNLSPDSTTLTYETCDAEVIKVRNYVKDLLKSRIFLGRYLERRLSGPRIGYRDIVLLSPAEVELKRDLLDVLNRLRLLHPTFWIGITDGESIGYSGVCLWTEIDNQPFGPFWFQIRSVKFREEEVIVTIKCVRHITESFLEVEPILTGSTKKRSNAPQYSQPDSTSSTEALSETYDEIKQTLRSALSIRNLKEFVTFICAFVIAVFTGSNAFINFLGNFILALIREISILIKNSTPWFLGLLDFFSKIVGGFYILMAMIFRPSNPNPVERQCIPYKSYEGRRRKSYNSYSYNYDPNNID